MRIVGINIPEEKQILIALTLIFGIGKSRAKYICSINKINGKIKVKNLTEKQINDIRECISEFMIEGNLRRNLKLNIKRLSDINCYRGIRHRKNLPVRGQRTKTNARTCKGPLKIIKK